MFCVFSTSPKSKLRVAGFTLIEMMVYMALLVLISGSAVVSLVSFSDTVQNYRANQLVMRSAVPLLERFTADVRSAQDVDSFSSTFDASPGTLVVMSGATTTTYTLTGGVVEVDVNGDTFQLTDGLVTVDALQFHFYDNLTTELVRMEVTLTATVGATTRTETFNTATVLRGSYE